MQSGVLFIAFLGLQSVLNHDETSANDLRIGFTSVSADFSAVSMSAVQGQANGLLAGVNIR